MDHIITMLDGTGSYHLHIKKTPLRIIIIGNNNRQHYCKIILFNMKHLNYYS